MLKNDSRKRSNALFSDGAAAVILSSEPMPAPGKALVYRGGHSVVMPDSQDLMSWTIGDTGFMMGLSSQVPDRIGTNISSYIDGVLASHDLSRSDLSFWAVHPGGIQIVRQVQTALNLAQSQLQDSYDVLRNYGNMSSPTVLFILKQILERLNRDELPTPNQLGGAMAFEPGLTIECALFEVV